MGTTLVFPLGNSDKAGSQLSRVFQVGQIHTRLRAAPQKEMLVLGLGRSHTPQRGRSGDRVNVEPIFCPSEEISPCSN